MPQNSSKKVIGLTGGIGSGKSVIALIFNDLGVPVFDSDLSAKMQLTGNPDVVKKVTVAFGNDILDEMGLPHRQKLAAVVFNNPAKLSQLNAIIHPQVHAEFNQWLAKQTAPYVVRESALLFETGFFKYSFKNILVTAPEELRIQRVMKRNGITENEVKARMKNQWTDAEKIKLSDFEIVNDEHTPVLPQVWKIIDSLNPTL